MLALNKKTDYGLIAMLCMASKPDEVISAHRMAQMYGMSQPLLTNVLKTLTHGGLVSSVRGANGGYQLTRMAEQINLAQLVEALQGPLKLVACANQKSEEGFECDLAGVCPVQSPVRKVHLKFMDFLENISLADLLKNNGE